MGYMRDGLALDHVVYVLRLLLSFPLAIGAVSLAPKVTNDTGDWRLGALLVAYALLNLAFHATRLSSFAWTNGLAAAMSEPRPRVDWSEQVVLVTGGAGGIGSAIVTALLKAECKTVVVVDRDEVTTEGVRSYKCDLTDVDQLTATIASIKKEVGAVTVLVNNAGTVSGKLITDLTPAEFRKTLNLNLVAPFQLMQSVLPDMISAKRGHIISIASVFAWQGCSQLSDYAASKHALRGLHSSLRQELGDYPEIKTTLVYPGHVKTPLFASIKPPSRVVRFLAPQVHPSDVADQVMLALSTHTSRELYVPFYGSLLWALEGVPSYLRDLLIWTSDANNAMKSFQSVERKRA